MDIFRIKPNVEKMLIKKRDLQQDDYRLISNIWYQQLITFGYDPSTMSALKLLELYSSGKLAPAESIRRSRQLLQEQNPKRYGQNRSRSKQQEKVRQEVLFQKNINK